MKGWNVERFEGFRTLGRRRIREQKLGDPPPQPKKPRKKHKLQASAAAVAKRFRRERTGNKRRRSSARTGTSGNGHLPGSK